MPHSEPWEEHEAACVPGAWRSGTGMGTPGVSAEGAVQPVAQVNIEHFRKLLAEEKVDTKRLILIRLWRTRR